MSDERGGEPERIAPIIPLFDGTAQGSRRAKPVADSSGSASDRALDVVPRRTGDAGLWRSTWDEPAKTERQTDRTGDGTPSDRHPARGARRAAERPAKPRLRALNDPASFEDAVTQPGAGEQVPTLEELRAGAEEALVRKLRTRSLSVSEARLVLKGHGLDAATIDDVIQDFCRRGYLDDAVLAELLVTSGIERKGQGRVALARALAQRGLPRDVIDAALDELPDDDAERALEFARSKARSMNRLEPDAALRRLLGQLARRGYGGQVAMNAAKTALREASFGGSVSGVRFVDSD